ncbi:coagulation factor IX-like [Palaemon carinicauda]|uniref:coagulation factor IX-like n=1 Tax=Palaemon carinicauda TaxID=392227 RepID=UPI0035B598D7
MSINKAKKVSISLGPLNLGSFGGQGGGGGGGGDSSGGGSQEGSRQDNPFNNILGQAFGFFNQFTRPPNNNNNNNQGGGNNNNNQRPPGNVLGNVNIGGIPIQVTSQNGGFGVVIGSCNNNNGGCEQGCRMMRGRVRCFCQNGFLLRQDGRTCQDFDECQQGNNGGCSEICNNTPGSFSCSCRSGVLQPDQRTCSGGFGPGPSGFPNCNINNGGCEQLCQQNGIAVQCGCRPGFALGRDGKQCLRVDVCVNDNGGCEDICNVDEGGNRECSCFPGRRPRRDGLRCRDIDECRQNNGGCEQICQNTDGSFTCQCNEGFTLLQDGRCQANQVPTPQTTLAPVILPPTSGECGINPKKNSFMTRIVGGRPADPKDWPWMAAFVQRSGTVTYCGGTLINNLFVLTAAHCMAPFSQNEIFVRLGEYDFSDSSGNRPTDFNVAEVRMHERYNSNTQENDIALVRLDRIVTFSDFIKPVCLPPEGRSFVGLNGFVTGWGTIFSGGPTSSVLQEVVVPVWQPNECAAAYPNKIFPGMMCAGAKEGGKDSCQGDSGGPFHIQLFPERQWVIAGIVSWGIGCARPEKPGVYTEVTQYLGWIRSNARF